MIVWLFTTTATALQQKCYAHHHKAISQAKALHPCQGEGFLTEVAAMLRAAVALQGHKAQYDPQSFSALRQALERKAVQLLDSPRGEPCEEAVPIASMNSATISLPFWNTTALMPQTT